MNRLGILTLFLLGIFYGTPAFSQIDTVQVLGVEQFNRVLHLNPQVQLIDVRSAKEFKKSHIVGALLAEKSEQLFQIIDSLGDQKIYLLYCKYGERSLEAGKLIFRNYGIHICSLEGGFDRWTELGMEVEK